MHSDYGWLSILPPLTAILLAITTKRVMLSLLLGIILGWGVINGGHVLMTFSDSIAALLHVFTVSDQCHVLLFTLLMGALLYFVSRSGGVDGLILWMQSKAIGQTRRQAQCLTSFLGLGIFIESAITCLTVGTVVRPLFDKLKISREKLAYLCDSTSSPVCMLIPFNGWGATVLGLLSVQATNGYLGDTPVLTLFAQATIFNFYVILSVAFVFLVSYFDWHIGPMKAAEKKAETIAEHTESQISVAVSRYHLHQPTKPGVDPRAMMMIMPLSIMLLFVFLTIYVTGLNAGRAAGIEPLSILPILQHASGALAVLVGVAVAVVLTAVMMWVKKDFSFPEITGMIVKGARGMLPMAFIMMLAFTIGATCQVLNTGPWIASQITPFLSPSLVAALVFLVSCCVSFSTGSSWATFAVMIPLAVPLAATMNADPAVSVSIPLVISAVLGGSVFGDHCSPVSDTTIIASMACGCEHIEHVRTQLPYALLAGSLSFILYCLFGFFA